MSGRPASPEWAARSELRRPGWRAGVILLVLIAALLAFSVFRVRRRMGMGGATGRMWAVAIAGIAIGILVFWVLQTRD